MRNLRLLPAARALRARYGLSSALGVLDDCYRRAKRSGTKHRILDLMGVVRLERANPDLYGVL